MKSLFSIFEFCSSSNRCKNQQYSINFFFIQTYFFLLKVIINFDPIDAHSKRFPNGFLWPLFFLLKFSHSVNLSFDMWNKEQSNQGGGKQTVFSLYYSYLCVLLNCAACILCGFTFIKQTAIFMVETKIPRIRDVR